MAPTKLFTSNGARHGSWTVLDADHRNPANNLRAPLCRCACGAQRAVLIANLVNGLSTNCGCDRSGTMSEKMQTHGLRRHLLYGTWQMMVARCTNPEHRVYRHYGGRGIQVCERWLDVAAFIADVESMLGVRPDRHTLDRIDVDGNYEPGNVRWASRSEQNANRRPVPRRSRCKRGHEMTPENTKVHGGRHRCRACSVTREHGYYLAKKAKTV